MTSVLTFPVLGGDDRELNFSVRRDQIIAVLGDRASSEIYFEGGKPVLVDTPHDDALEGWTNPTPQ